MRSIVTTSALTFILAFSAAALDLKLVQADPAPVTKQADHDKTSTTATSEKSIEIDGLTLPCANCSANPNGQYSIVVHGQRIATSADSAVVQLLSAIDIENFDGIEPATAELSRYLLGAKRGSAESKLALQLLMSTEAGRVLMAKQSGRFLALYISEIAELIAAGKGDETLWLALWGYSPVIDPSGSTANNGAPNDSDGGRNGIETKSAALKAAIALRHPKLQLDGLIDDLPVLEPDRDQAWLDKVIEAERALKPEWAAELVKIRDLVRGCAAEIAQQAGKREFILFNCSAERLAPRIEPSPGAEAAGNKAGKTGSDLSPSASNYLLRSQLALVLQFLNSHQLSPDSRLSAIRQTDFRNHRTPSLHEALLKAVREAGDSNYPAIRTKSVREEHFPMFEVFAEADPAIKKALVVLLNRAAVDAWNTDSPELTISVLELSFKIFPQSDPSRADFVQVVSLSTVVRNSAEMSSRVRNLGIQNVIIEGPDKRLTIGIAAIAMLLMLLIIAVYVRKNPPPDPNRAPTLAELRKERQDLLEYFGFSEICTDQELTRVFRTKAKELHPDAGGESGAEFSHVVEKYNRLKALLSAENNFSDAGSGSNSGNAAQEPGDS